MFKSIFSFCKIKASSLFMGLFLIIFMVILGCGAIFAEETTPENPIVETSADFQADDAVLLCENDKDESVYIPLPVASEQTPQEEEEKTDDGLNEEEQQEEIGQEEEPQEPEKTEETSPDEPQKEPVSSPGGGVTENNGPTGNEGTAGGNTENGNSTSVEYFTTSIKDGETVTSSDYSFEINHKITSLKVKELEVFVNGQLVPQFGGHVELNEGENKIRVKVDYVDASGKAVASPFKDYTVYLDTQSLVINTSLTDCSVDRDLFTFTATASYLGETVPVTVTLNGDKVTGSGDSYRVRLKDGANTIVLSAESGGLTKKETYTVTYTNSGNFDFETDITDGMVVGQSQLSFSVWMVNSKDAQISVRLNGGQTIQGEAGENFKVDLVYGDNTISITARDGEQKVSRTYQIRFERPKASDDNPIPDPEHAPRLESNLSDGMVVNNGKYTVDLIGYDYKGNRLHASNIQVTLNGSEVALSGENEKTTYLLELYTPENVVTVYLEDGEGYSAKYIYHLTYNKTDGPIGYATVSVEAATLGLGYIIPPTQVEIYDGEPAAYVVDRLFENNGIRYDYNGTFDDQFYLMRIYKDGITSGYQIPETLLGYLDADGVGLNGQCDPNSLGDSDFASHAGWYIAIDEFYPNTGLSGVNLNDGQRLCIRFTLNLGRDIGGLNGAAGEYPEKFIEPY